MVDLYLLAVCPGPPDQFLQFQPLPLSQSPLLAMVVPLPLHCLARIHKGFSIVQGRYGWVSLNPRKPVFRVPVISLTTMEDSVQKITSRILTD
jgi:hypothetical protein